MTNQPIVSSKELYEAVYNADYVIQTAYALKYGKHTEKEDVYGEDEYRQDVATNIQLAEKQKKERKRTLIIIPFLLVPVTFCLLQFFVVILGLIDLVVKVDDISSIVLITSFIASVAICMFSFIKTYKNKQYLYTYEAARKAEENANNTRHQLEMFIKENEKSVAIIAPEFRYPIATAELVRIFQLGRAATLPEAYDKLELKLHQMKVEEGLGTMIALQIAQIGKLEEIKYNTEWL